MNREIKFRAWEKYEPDYAEEVGNSGEMHYTEDYGKDEELYDKRTVVISGFYHDSGWDWDDFELMQYTNLKDKNDKEIYEGDVLKSPFAEGFVVEGDGYELLRAIERNLYPVEIIGNIYENPELLKENE